MTEKDKKQAQRYAKMKATMVERYGKDFYSKIGTKGGKNGDNRPFRNRDLASRAGRISGAKKKKQ